MRVRSETLEELFTEALRGMMEYLEPMVFKNNDAEADQVIRLAAVDRTNLLADFLNEIARLAQENNELYEKVTFHKLTETELTAELYGRSVEQFEREMRTIDNHNIKISRNREEYWEAEVIF